MKSICLIGFMGSGKTTVGRKIAEKLSMDFFDTDHEVEHITHKDIPSIFHQEGEATFRYYETEVLKKMPTTNVVIATGGGIIEKAENREWIKKHFYVVYLNPSFEIISARLKKSENRPLWNQEMDEKRKLFENRRELYMQCADYVIDIEDHTPEEVVQIILKSI